MKNKINKLHVLGALIVAFGFFQVVRGLVYAQNLHYTSAHTLTSALVDIAGAGLMLYILRWRQKWTYGLIALITFSDVPIFLWGFYMYLNVAGLQTLLNTPPYNLEMLLNFLEMISGLATAILSIDMLLYIVKQERRTRIMSDKELVVEAFIGWRKHWEHVQNKEDKAIEDIAKKATINAAWDEYELRRRNPHLADIIKAAGSSDLQAKEAAFKEIVERFGDDTLQPLRKQNEKRED